MGVEARGLRDQLPTRRRRAVCDEREQAVGEAPDVREVREMNGARPLLANNAHRPKCRWCASRICRHATSLAPLVPVRGTAEKVAARPRRRWKLRGHQSNRTSPGESPDANAPQAEARHWGRASMR